ncbi:hypothetical protein AB0L59_25220 [Streptomyces sp. NPDC052109]|uniref:hypothetical protein n=1 Tax=Streptomyces sp. NPDC052109 TaxID=3155527 RepID=UPI003436FC18
MSGRRPEGADTRGRGERSSQPYGAGTSSRSGSCWSLAGGDPDTPDASTGLPVLCRAIAAYDEPVAEALVQSGADPLRRLPDRTTAPPRCCGRWRAARCG